MRPSGTSIWAVIAVSAAVVFWGYVVTFNHNKQPIRLGKDNLRSSWRHSTPEEAKASMGLAEEAGVERNGSAPFRSRPSARIVSSRQRDTRTIPLETWSIPAVTTCASKMRILVPSLGAVLIGCHSNDMAPSPVAASNAGSREGVPCIHAEKPLMEARQTGKSACGSTPRQIPNPLMITPEPTRNKERSHLMGRSLE